jgi:hypothetical protein
MAPEAELQAACCDLVADVVRTSGKVQLKVAGLSMIPFLWPGDIVTVRHCDPSELQTNWIIVLRQRERLIVHRFLYWAGDSVVTRGDARPRYDEPARATEVLGQVESILRNGRQISLGPSLWKGATASLLRRSEWCTWLFLRLSCRVRRFEVAEATLGHIHPNTP